MKRSEKLPIFNKLAMKCFETAFIPMRNFRLGGLHFLNMPEHLPANRPVLLVGNHVSNWDGFIFREIQRRLRPDWPIYSVMIEEEIRRLPFFRLLGGLGIKPESAASVARALRQTKKLRETNPDFFFSFFPQGKIYPSFKRPLDFKNGIDLFIRALSPLTLLPVGLHMEPMGKLSPTYFISLGRPMKIDRPSPVHRVLEDMVQAETDKIHSLLSRHGESFSKQMPVKQRKMIPS